MEFKNTVLIVKIKYSEILKYFVNLEFCSLGVKYSGYLFHFSQIKRMVSSKSMSKNYRFYF